MTAASNMPGSHSTIQNSCTDNTWSALVINTKGPSCRADPHTERAATQRTDVLAPNGPNRTAAQSSGGNTHKSSDGTRAISGPVPNAMSPTATSDIIMSAASSFRRGGSSLTRQEPYWTQSSTTGATSSIAVPFENVVRNSAEIGL